MATAADATAGPVLYRAVSLDDARERVVAVRPVVPQPEPIVPTRTRRDQAFWLEQEAKPTARAGEPRSFAMPSLPDLLRLAGQPFATAVPDAPRVTGIAADADTAGLRSPRVEAGSAPWMATLDPLRATTLAHRREDEAREPPMPIELPGAAQAMRSLARWLRLDVLPAFGDAMAPLATVLALGAAAATAVRLRRARS